MTKIEGIKGRRPAQSPSGYTRLFGNKDLGNLMSKIQGAVISSGTELEKLIWARVKQIENFDLFLNKHITQIHEGIWIAKKEQVKQSKYIKSEYEPDLLAFELRTQICYVIEIKDGDQFDTKKSNSEYVGLHNFANSVKYTIPLTFQIRICCFNATTKLDIYNGLKRKFSMGEILTGQELCGLLKINYFDIIAARNRDQQINVDFFIDELLSINYIKEIIINHLRG
ncbi:hypothetical protein LCGC14_1391610 [marine sediment metagenome]|uniref:Uncharacterized protein n=1 Tax=marine sediment metagenome TaxID=412755 RepID=A0A0F9KKN4_9ZZZZ